jgi:hypothetical protein
VHFCFQNTPKDDDVDDDDDDDDEDDDDDDDGEDDDEDKDDDGEDDDKDDGDDDDENDNGDDVDNVNGGDDDDDEDEHQLSFSPHNEDGHGSFDPWEEDIYSVVKKSKAFQTQRQALLPSKYGTYPRHRQTYPNDKGIAKTLHVNFTRLDRKEAWLSDLDVHLIGTLLEDRDTIFKLPAFGKVTKLENKEEVATQDAAFLARYPGNPNTMITLLTNACSKKGTLATLMGNNTPSCWIFNDGGGHWLTIGVSNALVENDLYENESFQG